MKKNFLWIQNTSLKQLHKTFKTISGSKISDENKGIDTGYLFSEQVFFYCQTQKQLDRKTTYLTVLSGKSYSANFQILTINKIYSKTK